MTQGGWLANDVTHPHATSRPESDRNVLAPLLERLDAELAS